MSRLERVLLEQHDKAAAFHQHLFQMCCSVLRGVALMTLTRPAEMNTPSLEACGGPARRFGVDALSMLVGGAEWKEGMAAFAEKRQPRFDD